MPITLFMQSDSIKLRGTPSGSKSLTKCKKTWMITLTIITKNAPTKEGA